MAWPVLGFQRLTIPLHVPLASVPSGENASAVTLPLAFGTLIRRSMLPVDVSTISTWSGRSESGESADTAAVDPSGLSATASPKL